ncbi:3-Deoxy-D-manno-octulosonate 8-phosphate (KDO 8-P phosphatase) kdsC-like [Candidatus Glomeribacter gigasporarum BEG34]|uniref:3-deoxy-D-manno-octulosonate 8-phosphate phosphatase KdsC n=1 Tax=Candidatus Glomeribacter gigasporarum BEG34 TaxID=1070319 RepID=G2JC50_9BURK|nr:HAD hydrolase family protein [Candidatus Glomeribacter gigasporarum]CCD30358.1 3-Deoxy-D-manno-octulosonate 8-phosphate (KDO 8-P phosphatase) kdsC-like [Candidatus Glomeribacter gigasporarum BEG34]
MATAPVSPCAAVTARAAQVQLMIFDVDGVLTDGRLTLSETGALVLSFHVHDGQGIKLLARAGVQIALITRSASPIIAARAGILGIERVYSGVSDKKEAFADLLLRTGFDAQQCGYMGDDWPDLPVMQQVHFAAAPANARPEVRACAHWVTQATGGHGAAREVCDLLLRAQHGCDTLPAEGGSDSSCSARH